MTVGFLDEPRSWIGMTSSSRQAEVLNTKDQDTALTVLR
jgi:hypothetical protein